MEKTSLLKNSTDTLSYAFGMSLANDLKQRGINALNASVLAQAITDVYADSTLLLSEEEQTQTISKALQAAADSVKQVHIDEGASFLKENATKTGVQTTVSGLQYLVISEGNGAKPTSPTDEVTVHYKGTLVNGKQFDSSYDRNETISFGLNQVIKGWTEGLQLMSVGSHYRFFIPYDLGYGERGAGSDIPPYSALIFDVELFKINGK